MPVIDKLTEIAQNIAKGGLGIDIVFCSEADSFYIYQDDYWQVIYDMELAKMIIDHPHFRDRVLIYSVVRRKQILDNLKIILQKRLEFFNAKGYINFDFAEFDPIENKYHSHNKEHYSTIRIAYPNMENIGVDLWLKTLNEIFENEYKKVAMLQEFFGYCLTRNTEQRKALLLLGESNCGKSTILNILRSMIGKANCSSVPLKYISHPQYTPMLINKLVNIDSDVSARAEEFEAQFKIITSGEPVSCNQKFIETFEFIPYCKLVMAANVFPKITDHSSAFYNRLILIPCNRVFTEKEQDKNLFKKLEQELFGIFQWAVLGLERLQKRGMFEELEFVREAVQELEDENNPSNVFFNEHVEIEMGGYIEKSELYDKYKAWGERTKTYVLSKSRFGMAVYKKFHKLTPKETNEPSIGKRVWRNLKYVDNKDHIKETIMQFTRTEVSTEVSAEINWEE